MDAAADVSKGLRTQREGLRRGGFEDGSIQVHPLQICPGTSFTRGEKFTLSELPEGSLCLGTRVPR